MALDPVLRTREHVGLCAALAAAGATEEGMRHEMDSSYLCTLSGVSEAKLPALLAELDADGYVTLFREYSSGQGDRTVWVSLTTQGADAYDRHLQAVRAIAEGQG
ncbi:hypothetical protein CCICO_01055 [Corynebacterium ciconiae DSM 44920]|uniref:hypothetical protein n=1 Tax=Corynebacterium ciconiae TaxID=227319 RepID=UPI00037F55AB|nr:hypothetical protein [Corynebacterium ciconiae]WKD60269.1 hypothetical protein CCICO_01055 [Corynebacterium ciconiae DSM 44920]